MISRILAAIKRFCTGTFWRRYNRDEMKTVDEIRACKMRIEELQQQKNLRDAQVQRLRAECGEIHKLMEPIWDAEAKASAGPANLRQRLM